jgi:hypothetical protein
MEAIDRIKPDLNPERDKRAEAARGRERLTLSIPPVFPHWNK